MTYKQAVSALDAAGGGRFLKHSLSQITDFLARLASPQEKIRCVHVAGTNGKGSSCAMLEAVLRAEGYKTGMFTSPHLSRYNERFKVCGKSISNANFARLFTLVADAQRSFFKNPAETFSFFETLTIIAFIYFCEESVDFLLLETGLGGRLDATNIIKAPLVSVITSVGFDHVDILGADIPSIAFEKAGIIKKNCPVVLCLNNRDVYNIMRAVCDGQNAKLYFAGGARAEILTEGTCGYVFSAFSDFFSYEKIGLGLFGRYQIDNALGVLTAVEALRRERGVAVSGAAVRRGLKKCRWPSRMEIVSESPMCVIDGAHNPDGARAFCDALSYFAGRRVVLIVGVLENKQIAGIVNCLSKLRGVIIVTKPPSASAAKPSDLADAFYAASGRFEKIIIENDYEKAVLTALNTANENDIIAVTGSLYLCGAARRCLKCLISKKK